MGLLKDLVNQLKSKEVEDTDLIKELEEAGETDADKIAKKMGQMPKKDFVPKVDVSDLPIEMPPEEQTVEELSKDDEGPSKDNGSR